MVVAGKTLVAIGERGSTDPEPDLRLQLEA